MKRNHHIVFGLLIVTLLVINLILWKSDSILHRGIFFRPFHVIQFHHIFIKSIIQSRLHHFKPAYHNARELLAFKGESVLLQKFCYELGLSYALSEYQLQQYQHSLDIIGQIQKANDIRIFLLKSLCYLKMNDLAEARVQYHQAEAMRENEIACTILDFRINLERYCAGELKDLPTEDFLKKTSDLASIMTMGDLLYNTHHFDEATLAYNYALQKYGRDGMILYRKAIIAGRIEKDPVTAKSICEEILQKQPQLLGVKREYQSLLFRDYENKKPGFFPEDSSFLLTDFSFFNQLGLPIGTHRALKER